MNTLYYAQRWQCSLFCGSTRTVSNLLYSLLNLILFALERLSRCRDPLLSRTACIIEQSTQKMGIALIRNYQRYLSPYKGFSCAHRILYGGESCSQYVKKTLLERDLRSAIALSRRRFSACKTAKIVLHSEKLEKQSDSEKLAKTEERKKKKKRKQQSTVDRSSDGCFDLTDCSCFFLDLGGSENCGNFGDCGGDWDCTPDCGDCGGCDCG